MKRLSYKIRKQPVFIELETVRVKSLNSPFKKPRRKVLLIYFLLALVVSSVEPEPEWTVSGSADLGFYSEEYKA